MIDIEPIYDSLHKCSELHFGDVSLILFCHSSWFIGVRDQKHGLSGGFNVARTGRDEHFRAVCNDPFLGFISLAGHDIKAYQTFVRRLEISSKKEVEYLVPKFIIAKITHDNEDKRSQDIFGSLNLPMSHKSLEYAKILDKIYSIGRRNGIDVDSLHYRVSQNIRAAKELL